MSNIVMKNERSNTTNEVKGNFEEAYDMLPHKYRTQVRLQIAQKCGWKSQLTFHLKRKGNTTITILEAPVIEASFEAHNINAWTGEYIKQLQY